MLLQAVRMSVCIIRAASAEAGGLAHALAVAGTHWRTQLEPCVHRGHDRIGGRRFCSKMQVRAALTGLQPGVQVPGGLTAAEVAWWSALRKPLNMRLRVGPRLAAAWAAAQALSLAALVTASLSGGIVHQARPACCHVHHVAPVPATFCMLP